MPPTMMVSEVYDALIEAGASEEKSRKAAEAVASYNDRFANIEHRCERIDGRMTLLQWMLASNLAFTLAILWRVFVR